MEFVNFYNKCFKNYSKCDLWLNENIKLIDIKILKYIYYKLNYHNFIMWNVLVKN